MSAIDPPMPRRIAARLASYGTRRHAFVAAMALVHGGLLATVVGLVVRQVESGPVQVFATGLLAVVAVVVLLSPGSAAALVFLVGCGLCYLLLSALHTEIGVVQHSPSEVEVIALAAAMFLVHAVDALRETLPADATVEPAVLTTWARRVAEALLPGLVIGGLVIALPTAERSSELLWLVGAAGLLLAVGLPAMALRPRPWVDDADQGATNQAAGRATTVEE